MTIDPKKKKKASSHAHMMRLVWDTFLLIHIFKTNFSKIYPKKKLIHFFFKKRKIMTLDHTKIGHFPTNPYLQNKLIQNLSKKKNLSKIFFL